MGAKRKAKSKAKPKAKAKHPDYPRDENGKPLPYVIVQPEEAPPTPGRPYFQTIGYPPQASPHHLPRRRFLLSQLEKSGIGSLGAIDAVWRARAFYPQLGLAN